MEAKLFIEGNYLPITIIYYQFWLIDILSYTKLKLSSPSAAFRGNIDIVISYMYVLFVC